MRVDNWHSRLVAALDEMERQPHVYGESDCLMRAGWAAAAQLADPKRGEILAVIEKYHGRYSSMDEAAALLAADGLTSLSLVAQFFEEVDIGKRADGFIGALRQDGETWGFGIFMRGHLHVATPDGAGILPSRMAEKVFRVE